MAGIDEHRGRSWHGAERNGDAAASGVDAG